MAGGQWEVVGGKAKKSKSSKIPAPKVTAKEKIKENSSSDVLVTGPIHESQTIYNAFLEKEKKDDPKPKVNGTENSKQVEKNVQKRKKADKKPIASKALLEEIFSSISEEEFKNQLATVEVLCPDSPLYWLKDLASYLNVKLDLPVEDLLFSSKPSGYPCLLLKKKVHQMILGIFSRCTPQILQIFHEFCLQSMVQDILKGLHTLGFRLLLQCLAQAMPSVVLGNLDKYTELCSSHRSRQNVCLSLLWAAGQAGNSSLEAGFKVWIDLMFPLIGSKHCTVYIVEYIEKLMSQEEVLKCNKSLLGVRELFPVMDFIYSKELPKNIQKRLIAIYPSLKVLSYGSEPQTVLRNYFPSYLRRLEPQCPQPLQNEILNSLMYCLEKDGGCYSIWRQLYTKHLVQSKLLISHINDQWEKVPPKFPKRCLKDTLSVFQVTNEELLTSDKKSHQDVEECILINKELLLKLNSGVFSWPRLTLLLVLIVSSLLTCDILNHGCFTDSKTGQILKDAGALTIMAQAGEKWMVFYQMTNKYLEQYFPIVSSWVQEGLVPFLEVAMKKFSSILVLLWEGTDETRVWCNENVPPLLNMVEEQFISSTATLKTMVENTAVILSKSFLTVLSNVLYYADSFGVWLQSNPELMNVLEMVRRFASTIAENVQQNVTYLFQLFKNYFPIA